jgi:hypothetical protein
MPSKCRECLGRISTVKLFLRSLDWFGLVWVGLGWFGLVWVGLGWFGLVWVGLGWFGLS